MIPSTSADGALVLLGTCLGRKPVMAALHAGHQAKFLRWTLDTDEVLRRTLALQSGLLVITHVRTLAHLREVRAWLRTTPLTYYIVWAGPDRPYCPRVNERAHLRRCDAELFVEPLAQVTAGKNWSLRFTQNRRSEIGISADF